MNKVVYVLLLLVLGSTQTKATHLVGGSFTIQWLSGNTYKVTLKILRDCENGNRNAYFDFPLTAGIFDKSNNVKKTEIEFTLQDFVKDDTLKFTGANCPEIITGCTHIGIYSKTITLNPTVYNSTQGYYISWERCCRNGIINNIINPGDAAMVLYAEFPRTQFTINSTPYFTNNPVTLLCINNTFKYNLKFVDDDGDELKYSLINPLNGNLDRNGPTNNGNPRSGIYPTTVWQNGYSVTNVIPGSIPLQINTSTGEIICNPSSPGVYVASILVEEYRFGIKIGEVRLELQFTVTMCANDPPLGNVITLDNQVVTDTIYVKIPEKLQVRIRTIDIKDSVYMRVTTPFNDSTMVNLPIFDSVANGYKSAETMLIWQSDCEHEKLTQAIPFYLNAVDNGCPIAKNSSSAFYVKFIPRSLLPPPSMLCMTLVDNKETIFYWGDTFNYKSPDFKMYYVYRITNNSGNKTTALIDSIFDPNTRFYIDKFTPDYDKINYSYFISAVNLCNNQGTFSDTISTFNQLKYLPDNQFLRFVTVQDNKELAISWPKTWEKDFAKYFLYKSDKPTGNFNLLATFEHETDTFFVDKEVDVSKQSMCYYLIMKDTCDNLSLSGQVSCSMVLKGDAKEFVNYLSWSDYVGWKVQDYYVNRQDPAIPFASIAVCVEPKFTDDKLNLNEGLFSYYITATQAQELQPYFQGVSRSNTIDLVQKPMVYLPNAFTANGDGLNDNWMWLPVFVKDFRLRVFNRWGETVFETNDKLTPWNGTYKGELAPSDVYFYTLYYNGWEGTEKTQSGNFTILR